VDLQLARAEDALGSLVVLGAARLGATRLIDNWEFWGRAPGLIPGPLVL